MANLIIISGASGSGKTSLIKAMLADLAGVSLSISHTTRTMRPGEVDGVNYHFCNLDEFSASVKQGLFLEHAQVFDNFYGTQASSIQDQLSQGLDVIVEIDWQGAQQVRKQFPDAISISILPPSLTELETRLTGRGQDSKAIIDRRMQDAQLEMSHYNEYDYLVINEDFALATKELASIITSQRLSLLAQKDRIETILTKGLL